MKITEITLDTATIRALMTQVEKIVKGASEHRPILQKVRVTIEDGKIKFFVCDGFVALEASSPVAYDGEKLEIFIDPVKLRAMKSETEMRIFDTKVEFWNTTTNVTVTTPIHEVKDDDRQTIENLVKTSLNEAQSAEPVGEFSRFDQKKINDTINGYKGVLQYKVLDGFRMYIESSDDAQEWSNLVAIRALIMGLRR